MSSMKNESWQKELKKKKSPQEPGYKTAIAVSDECKAAFCLNTSL